MIEICEHDTFKDICLACHRGDTITRLTDEVERLKKMLWEVNEQCSEHVPLSLLTQIRAVLNKEPRT